MPTVVYSEVEAWLWDVEGNSQYMKLSFSALKLLLNSHDTVIIDILKHVRDAVPRVRPVFLGHPTCGFERARSGGCLEVVWS